MSGFINNYYYGKAGKADYTPDQLPTNRVSLFFEMLRIHFSGLFGVNLLYALFCLPAIAWTVLNVGALASGEDVSTILTMYLLLMIPCMGIAGVGAPGLMYVLRNWARDQHAFVLSDFRDNVKSNWKSGLLVGLLNGLSLCITYVGFIFYRDMSVQSFLYTIPQMFVVMVCALWWMMNMLVYTMMVTYDMKFTQLIRNCAIIAIARLPWSALFLVGAILPAVLVTQFLGTEIVILVLLVFYVALGFALTGLVYASYANASFDRFLNPNIEGAPINLGLRGESDDDDLDDIEDPNPVDQ